MNPAQPAGTRVAPLSSAEAHAAAAEAGLPEYAADLMVFRILLHHPPLAAALNGLVSFLLFRGRLDVRLRELAIMRIGWTSGSVYEWTQHWRIAGLLGVDEQDLATVRDWETSDRFGPVERAVLQAVDDTAAAGTISDATWSACAEHLEPAEMLELVAAIGNWRLFATMLRSLDVPLEDDLTAWPPDGRVPPRAGAAP